MKTTNLVMLAMLALTVSVSRIPAQSTPQPSQSEPTGAPTLDSERIARAFLRLGEPVRFEGEFSYKRVVWDTAQKINGEFRIDADGEVTYLKINGTEIPLNGATLPGLPVDAKGKVIEYKLWLSGYDKTGERSGYGSFSKQLLKPEDAIVIPWKPGEIQKVLKYTPPDGVFAGNLQLRTENGSSYYDNSIGGFRFGVDPNTTSVEYEIYDSSTGTVYARATIPTFGKESAVVPTWSIINREYVGGVQPVTFADSDYISFDGQKLDSIVYRNGQSVPAKETVQNEMKIPFGFDNMVITVLGVLGIGQEGFNTTFNRGLWTDPQPPELQPTPGIYLAMGNNAGFDINSSNGKINVRGADLSNDGQLNIGDSISKFRTGLTNTYLPELADGNLITADGILIGYQQSVLFNPNGKRTVNDGTSGGDLAKPEVYLDIGSMSNGGPEADFLYAYFLMFNKPLNISSAYVQGKVLKILGQEYMIAPISVFDNTTKKLVLYSHVLVLALAGGDERVIVLSEKGYTVKVLGVSSPNLATITVDGDSQTVSKGGYYIISGLPVYVEDVFYLSSTDQTQNSVKLNFGANKITLENGSTVKKGMSDTTVDGTYVVLSGTGDGGLQTVVVAVGGPDTSHDYILSGSSFEDPVWDDFRTAFLIIGNYGSASTSPSTGGSGGGGQTSTCGN